MTAAAAAEVQATRRRMMVDCQLRTYEITDRAVLAAFDAVPREAFVASDRASLAYADRDLPSLGNARRLTLAPMPLARMVQALRIGQGAKVLDIAGGAGYGAAVLAELGARVTVLETSWPGEADVALRAAPAGIVTVSGPLEKGHAANAPYDAILLHGAVEREPAALIAQLRDGGRLACGLIEGEACKVVCYERFGAAAKMLPLFDARLPLLKEFAAPPAFVF